MTTSIPLPAIQPALAMAPTVHYVRQPSPLGELIIAATGLGICGVYFEQHKYFHGCADWRHDPAQRHLALACRQLGAYFDGQLTRFALPLDLRGTPFQRSVWLALEGIGYGDTISYGDIARQIGRPSAVRATGTAIGRNPVSIVVPCHRVLGSSGTLTGYAGGVERKEFLLALERRR